VLILSCSLLFNGEFTEHWPYLLAHFSSSSHEVLKVPLFPMHAATVLYKTHRDAIGLLARGTGDNWTRSSFS
jgi:hypothetical protein